MNYKSIKFLVRSFIMTLFIITQLSSVFSQEQEKELIEPPVIQPEKKGKAPSDAIILFDRESLSNFESVNGEPASWKVTGNKFTVVPDTPNIQTKQKFGDCQLHVEWKTPRKDVRKGKEGQGSGNSGVYLMGKYEIQVLNSYNNKTYFHGQAGAIYDKYPPMVNASLKPGKWQTYDIIFIAPKYNKDGEMKTPGYFTVFHNGILIQYHKEIGEPTTAYNENASDGVSKLPLMLQNHENEVSYRNIWIREL